MTLKVKRKKKLKKEGERRGNEDRRVGECVRAEREERGRERKGWEGEKGKRGRGSRGKEKIKRRKKAAGGWEQGCLRGGHSIRKFYLSILVSYLSLFLFGKTH